MSDYQPPKPGPEHDRLKPFEGTFTSEVKIFMGPGEPMTSTGTMTNSFKIGGLYLHQDYVGDPNEGPFPEFIGNGYWGYNITANKYEGFWIDNASTMMQMESGDFDAGSNTWTMHSEFTNPMSGELMKRRTIITLIDNDNHRHEQFATVQGQAETKTMEITYNRM